jgi:hypothetical protein
LRPSSRPFLQDFLHGAAVAQLLQRQTDNHQDLLPYAPIDQHDLISQPG